MMNEKISASESIDQLRFLVVISRYPGRLFSGGPDYHRTKPAELLFPDRSVSSIHRGLENTDKTVTHGSFAAHI